MATNENERRRAKYWTEFLELKEARGSVLQMSKPVGRVCKCYLTRTQWLEAIVNIPDRRIQVGLILDGGAAKTHFSLLRQARDEIERAIGQRLEWDERPDEERIRSRIIVTRDSAGPSTPEAEWKDQHHWLYETLERFYQVFAPRVKSFESPAAVPLPKRAPPPSTEEARVKAPLETFHDYELLRRIDTGGMAESYQARHQRSGEVVFLKRVREQSADTQALERESRIYELLHRMRAKHLLKVLDFMRDGEYVSLVTEYADDGDLHSYVQTQGHGHGLEVAEAKRIGITIATAVQVLHDCGVVHRDLKPQNILSKDGEWKLADFGISKNLARVITQKTFRQTGTLGYGAPEQFEGVEARPSADVYSLGKILVFLLTGQTDPDRVPFPSWREVIRRCLSLEPEQRPHAQALIKNLESMPS
jgi:hypothetical protein